MGRGGKRATSGGSVDLPLEREGAGDGWSWYEQSIQETGREAGECQSPPYPIGTVPARREAIGQIYEHVAGKDPPPYNITSEAIRAYYPGIEGLNVENVGLPGTLHDIRVPHGLCEQRLAGH